MSAVRVLGRGLLWLLGGLAFLVCGVLFVASVVFTWFGVVFLLG